jgi:hypothetical protein
MSAVAAESPRRYARRTRRLTLDVSPESPAPRLFSSDPPHRSLVSNGCLPCALGETTRSGRFYVTRSFRVHRRRQPISGSAGGSGNIRRAARLRVVSRWSLRVSDNRR